MKKRKQYIKKSFESTGVSNDTSANIYESMLLSNAWLDMSKNQQLLYVYCKSQYYSEKKMYDDNANSFTMNRHKWQEKYKLYKKGNEMSFYNDMEELIKHGFIKCLKCGALARQKNIYCFSDKWRIWGRYDFSIERSEMTYRMLQNK